jgi:uncharacterized protein YdeI (YjbR/CyaY-like superfamily)
MNVTHFSSAEKFRLWLVTHHATATELQVGFYNKNSGRSGMTYKEAIDEALCFGWIDGVIRKIDVDSFTHRFTPRKPASIWSNVNVGHVARLTKAGRMHPAGLRAFEARRADRVGVYSFEQKEPQSLPPAYLQKFKATRKAWGFFTAQAPWYQRKIIHKIISGKKEPTRLRWLDRAIAASAAGTQV